MEHEILKKIKQLAKIQKKPYDIILIEITYGESGNFPIFSNEFNLFCNLLWVYEPVTWLSVIETDFTASCRVQNLSTPIFLNVTEAS